MHIPPPTFPFTTDAMKPLPHCPNYSQSPRKRWVRLCSCNYQKPYFRKGMRDDKHVSAFKSQQRWYCGADRCGQARTCATGGITMRCLVIWTSQQGGRAQNAVCHDALQGLGRVHKGYGRVSYREKKSAALGNMHCEMFAPWTQGHKPFQAPLHPHAHCQQVSNGFHPCHNINSWHTIHP